MKKNILFILVILLLSSCEEVIDIDLQNSDPKLVIEASVNVLKDGTSDAVVTLSQTAPFFENYIPPVTDALVSITSSTGDVYNFNHTQNGIYTANFVPVLENSYTLEVIYQNQTYTATESLHTVTEFEEVIQDNEGGFGGDQIQLKPFSLIQQILKIITSVKRYLFAVMKEELLMMSFLTETELMIFILLMI